MHQPFAIAYLAPEIPALSATFVYNEILGLERRGFVVIPISVHFPKAMATDEELQGLADRTLYLYRERTATLLRSHRALLRKSPLAYLATFFRALSDAMKIGILSHIGKGQLFRFFVAARVAETLQKHQCHHLHVHFAHVPTDIGMYASLLSGIPFSFTSHANDLFERGWLLREKVERARFAVTISRYNREFLARQGVEESKIKIVRCGVDTRQIQSVREDTPRRQPPVIGCLGRLVEKKGVDTLIGAVALLRHSGLHVRVEVAGDGPLRDELQRLAGDDGVGSLVTFLGAVPHHQVFEWLKTLDLFVLPCRKDSQGDQDGIPVVLMEAMASGIPVISTSISGIPELIVEGITGWSVDPGDSVALSGAIRSVLSNSSRTAQVARKAMEWVRQEFELETNVERLAQLFWGGMDE